MAKKHKEPAHESPDETIELPLEIIYRQDLEKGLFQSECPGCGEVFVHGDCDCQSGLKLVYLEDGKLLLRCAECEMQVGILALANDPATLN